MQEPRAKRAVKATPKRKRVTGRSGYSIDGAELKTRREKLGMTQRELGIALGSPDKPIPLTTISRWELGGTIEHPGMLARSLRVLEAERVGASKRA